MRVNSELTARIPAVGATAGFARTLRAVGLVVVALAVGLLLAVPASASFEQVAEFGGSGNASLNPGGYPGGLAVDEANGGLYAADGNGRVLRFDSQGGFLEAWGWGAVKPFPEIQQLTFTATSGTYSLSFEGETTEPIAYRVEAASSIENALNRLPSLGSAVLVHEIEKDAYQIELRGELIGVDRPQISCDGSGLSGSCATSTVENGHAGPGRSEIFLRHNQWFKVSAAGGTYTLDFAGQTTGAIAVGASAAEVQAALEALSTVGGAGGTVEVSEPQVSEYQVDFGGSLGGATVDPKLTADSSGLTGVGTLKVEIKIVPGFERCAPARGDVCQMAEQEGREGVAQLATPEGVAVDQATGNVYVLSGGRNRHVVQEFSSEGVYIAGFGDIGTVSPEQIASLQDLGIAVNAAGDVYLLDLGAEGHSARVMEFKPQTAGDYEHYVYAGQPSDLFVGKYAKAAVYLGIDDAGDFYVGKEGVLYKFGAGKLTSPAWEKLVDDPEALAVDPVSGDTYQYDGKHNKIERRSGVDGAVVEEVAVEEGLTSLAGVHGIAFNPGLAWPGGHPAGVLYADMGSNNFNEQRHGPVPSHAVAYAQSAHFPPQLDSESVSAVSGTTASLLAQINPRGSDTKYIFQYGTQDCASNSCVETPLGGGDLGTAKQDIAAAVTLSGLQPETTYHYRAIAMNAYGAVEGPDQTFTTYGASTPGLPDGRVYELVSPPFKDGGEVYPLDSQIGSCQNCKPGQSVLREAMQSAPGGNAVVYQGSSFAATGEAVGANEYLAQRTEGGWLTTDLSTSQEGRDSRGYVGFSADLSSGMLSHINPSLTPSAPEGYEDLYVREADGGLRSLLSEAPPHRTKFAEGGREFKSEFAGASSDFSHLLFQANDTLTASTADAPTAPEVTGQYAHNLYEWFEGRLRLVNVLPGNASAVLPAGFGAGKEYEGGEASPDFAHAISSDGSHVFWSNESTSQVYVRENGETTVAIPDPGRFVVASADGSRVLLNDGRIYDLAREALVDMTEGAGGFRGILGASEDLSRVYFVDGAVLPGAQENGYGATPQPGADNVYLYDASSGGPPRFIATLAAADNNNGVDGLTGDWEAPPNDRLAQVTADGGFAAFMSVAPLTGFANNRLSEVFEYEAASGRLACVSCNRTGAVPLGNGRLSVMDPVGSQFPRPQQGNLSEDGRVFFDSRDALSPFDTNGGVEDVYEYEPGGVGTCAVASGCVSLISSGHGTTDSNFVMASPSGGDVFFTTRDQLVKEDQDALVDLYDARVNGGFASVTPLQCTGTGCQGVPNAPPIFATPSSVTFAGVGNFEQPAASGKTSTKKKAVKCPKRKKYKGGKCVKAKRSKSARVAHHTGHGRGRR